MPMVEANGAAEAIFNRGFRYVFSPMTPAKILPARHRRCLPRQGPDDQDDCPPGGQRRLLGRGRGWHAVVRKGQGATVLYYEKVPADTKDVSAQLTQIKPKNPDLFISSGHYASAALVMKQSKELKFNPKAFGFSVGPALPQFTDTLKADAEYVFGGTQWTPSLKFQDEQFGTAQDYATKFKAFAGYDPAYQNAESSCAGQCFQQAIAKAGSIDSEKVRDALATLQFNILLRGRQVRQSRHQRRQANGRRANPERQESHRLAQRSGKRRHQVPNTGPRTSGSGSVPHPPAPSPSP